MDTSMVVILVFLVLSGGLSVYSWYRGRNTVGGDEVSQPSLFELALKLVIDAEEMIKPRDGETWDTANGRKLQYVLDNLKKAHPEINIGALRNIIEGAVDIFKGRLANVSRPTIPRALG